MSNLMNKLSPKIVFLINSKLSDQKLILSLIRIPNLLIPYLSFMKNMNKNYKGISVTEKKFASKQGEKEPFKF